MCLAVSILFVAANEKNALRRDKRDDFMSSAGWERAREVEQRPLEMNAAHSVSHLASVIKSEKTEDKSK